MIEVKGANGSEQRLDLRDGMSIGRTDSGSDIAIDGSGLDPIHSKIRFRDGLWILECVGHGRVTAADGLDKRVVQLEADTKLSIGITQIRVVPKMKRTRLNAWDILCPKCHTALANQAGETTQCGECSAELRHVTGENFSGWIPKYVGEFKICDFRGRGGMGVVLRGEYESGEYKGQSVAIKLFDAQESPMGLARFKGEIKNLEGLDHRHIVRLLDSFDSRIDDDFPWLAMEWVEGQSLTERMQEVSPLSIEEIGHLLEQIVIAMEYLHNRGVVHRDLKPGNILIGTDGSVKLADFGLAQVNSRNAPTMALTEAGAVVGTKEYLAPEVRNGAKATNQGDIYSLGIIWFEMLTGHLPDVDDPFDWKSERPETPPLWAAMVQQCLARDEENRPPLKQIRAAVAESATGGQQLPPPPPTERRPAHFRLALYGHTKAGKTCYLAALAMKRFRNPRRYTCNWVSGDQSYPTLPVDKPGEDLGDDDKLVNERWCRANTLDAPFALGKAWLKEQINRITKGEFPRQTPLTAMYRFVLKFGGKEWSEPVPEDGKAVQNGPKAAVGVARTYYIELIDYSGELVNSESDDDFTRKLRKHMREMDGLIVLAEAPVNAEQHDELSEMQHRMENAFDAIKRGKETFPVAMVINKGDRLLPFQQYAPAGADARVREFLANKPEPPHAVLRDVLENSVGSENFREFLASAFGQSTLCEMIPAKSRQVRRLRSFGLEDPFMWMASRCEQLLLERSRDEIANTRPWYLWQLVSGHHRRLREKVLKLSHVADDCLPLKKQVRRLRFSAGCARIGQQLVGSVAAVAMLCALILGMQTQSDLHSNEQYKNLVADIEFPANNAADLKKMQAAAAWYDGYAKRSLTRIISRWFISPEEALATSEKLTRRLDLEAKYRAIENCDCARLTEIKKTLLPIDTRALSNDERRCLGIVFAKIEHEEPICAADEELKKEIGKAGGDLVKTAEILVGAKSGPNDRRYSYRCDNFVKHFESKLQENLDHIYGDPHNGEDRWNIALRMLADVMRSADIHELMKDQYENMVVKICTERETSTIHAQERRRYEAIIEWPDDPAKIAAYDSLLGEVKAATHNEGFPREYVYSTAVLNAVTEHQEIQRLRIAKSYTLEIVDYTFINKDEAGGKFPKNVIKIHLKDSMGRHILDKEDIAAAITEGTQPNKLSTDVLNVPLKCGEGIDFWMSSVAHESFYYDWGWTDQPITFDQLTGDGHKFTLDNKGTTEKRGTHTITVKLLNVPPYKLMESYDKLTRSHNSV